MEIGFFPAGKWSGREVEHSPPPSTEAKTGGTIRPVPHAFSWRGVYRRQDFVYFKQKELNSTKLSSKKLTYSLGTNFDLGRDTDYADRGFSWFSSVRPGKC
jgi:hypothetical protein